MRKISNEFYQGELSRDINFLVIFKEIAPVKKLAQFFQVSIHDGRLLGLFLPEGSKSHFLAHSGVVYILNEARH